MEVPEENSDREEEKVMKRNRVYTITGAVLVLALCFGGCGSKAPEKPAASAAESKTQESSVTSQAAQSSAIEEKQSSETQITEPETSEVQTQQPTIPDVVVDPAEIKWGYEATGSDDTQHWYCNGDRSLTSYLFFDGDYVTKVEGEQREQYDVDIVNRHMVDWDTKGQVFDFVFTDMFTCYDYVSGLWFMRMDVDAVMQSLTSARFVCEAGEQWNIKFNNDYTFDYEFDGENITGNWWFDNARTISYHMDKWDENESAWFTMEYEDGGWEVVSIKDTDYFFPER